MRFILFCVALLLPTLALPALADASGGGVGPVRAAAIRFGQQRAAVRQVRAAELRAGQLKVEQLRVQQQQINYDLQLQRINQQLRRTGQIKLERVHVPHRVGQEAFIYNPQQPQLIILHDQRGNRTVEWSYSPQPALKQQAVVVPQYSRQLLIVR